MSTVDNKQARVAALIEKGKKNGSLTQKEIQEALADLQVSPEAYENILDRFEEMGIDVTGEAQEPPEEELAMEEAEAEEFTAEAEDLSVPEGIATDDPVATTPSAIARRSGGTVRTAIGETMDQNMACAHATPIRESMSV